MWAVFWSYFEEDSFDFAAVFASFFVHNGVQDVFGGNAGVGDAPVVAHHPNKDIWYAVLRLQKCKQIWAVNVGNQSALILHFVSSVSEYSASSLLALPEGYEWR